MSDQINNCINRRQTNTFSSQFFSTLVLIILVFATFAGIAPAQKVSPSQKSDALRQPANDARPENGNAYYDGQNGVLVEWQSHYELNILGYNIYRLDEKGGRVLLNATAPIAGSSLIVGDAPLMAGRGYQWFDKNGTSGAVYQIEEIAMDGTRRMREVTMQYDSGMLRRAGLNAQTLNQIGDQKTKQPQIEYPAPIVLDPTDERDAPPIRQQLSTNDRLVRQQWVAAQTGSVKIAVNRNGLYRVSKQMLQAAGFNIAANSVFWSLYVDGIEQPLSFGANNDYIEFYGTAIDTGQNDTRFYYLVSNSPTAGKRTTASSRRGFPSNVVGNNFSQIVEDNQRILYVPAILNGTEENFYGGIFGSAGIPANQIPTLTLRDIDTSVSIATFDIRLQGFTSSVNHHVSVKLNDVEVANLEGFGHAILAATQIQVPVSLLREGANTVQMNSLNGGNDYDMLDFARITYSRRYRANQNALLLTTGSGRVTQISGFTSSAVRVFDVTDPDNVTLTPATVTAGTNNDFRVNIAANRPRKLFAVADSQIISSAAVAPNTPSTWSSASLTADLFIFTHKDFRAAADRLAVYRRGQGLRVEVADIEDVFDEYSYGLRSADAIHDFLQAQNPHFAIFFGDASYDPCGFLVSSNGRNDFVPTQYFDSGYQEAATDEAMGDFDNDGIGEVRVGRLPVRDLATANLVVDKIIAFEAIPQKMERGVVFVADSPIGWDFVGSNNQLRSILPNTVPTESVNNDTDAATVRANLQNAINRGRFIVTYAGHGSNTLWSSSQILLNSDAPNFTNTNTSLFLTLTCLNGDFSNAGIESLAEAMIKAPHGAVAYWASSTLTTPDAQDIMGGELYRQLTDSNGPTRLGDALRPAKMATSNTDVRLSWILIGDPTLKIK